jgi:DNA mismatch repair protein MutL
MGKIHKLSPQLADMIAAGEVVERPASVVKELVENAIDAGATQIIVEIKNGGITFMRVTDNGCGISQEDAPTAFLRHATSKISKPEDLDGIVTMGFRGEALAAISAVSKIDLLTKAEGTDHGTSLRVEAGNVLDVSPAGCPQGTTIIVRELFYNTPARMKFLKRDSVEGSYIAGAVQRQALSHPEIAFRFIRDGKPELSTPGDGNLLSAIYAAMGRQCAKEMVEIQGTSQGITVRGYVGKPTANRGSRSYQHFFVNGRYVKSKMMSAALEEAYKNQMMVGRFPICVLHVEVAPEAVDVNVHPAKTEVKFLREGEIFDAIHYTVLGALHRTPDRPEVTIKPPQVRSVTPQSPAQAPTNVAAVTREFLGTLSQNKATGLRDSTRLVPGTTGSVSVPRTPLQAARPQVPVTPQAPTAPKAPVPTAVPTPAPADPVPPPPEQTAMELPKPPVPTMPEPPKPQQVQAPKGETVPYRIIGQTMDTYILVEQGDALLLIDKHAAHERILFEKLKAQPQEIMSQLLLRPIQADLSQEETGVLLSHSQDLSQLGFTLEDFGGGTLLIRAIPSDLGEQEAEACLSQLAQNYQEGVRMSPETVHDNLLHTIACKAAIKGGRKTAPLELEALVAQVLSRDDIKYCPHGRPVCITLTRAALERQFKRA